MAEALREEIAEAATPDEAAGDPMTGIVGTIRRLEEAGEIALAPTTEED